MILQFIKCHISAVTSLYSLMSFVRPLRSISPKGLFESGHLKNKVDLNTQETLPGCIMKRKEMAFLHHADVVDKLQGEGKQFVVGAGSKQTIIYNL